MSLARAEMAEQPAVLERLLRDPRRRSLAARTEIAERRPRFGVIAARGSSDNAARYAQHLFGRRWAMPVGARHAVAAHALRRAAGLPRRARDRDLAVRRLARRGGGRGDRHRAGRGHDRDHQRAGLALAQAARHVIDLRTGPERSVAATKTYTASLGAIAALAGERRDRRPGRDGAAAGARGARRTSPRAGSGSRSSAAASPTGRRSRPR